HRLCSREMTSQLVEFRNGTTASPGGSAGPTPRAQNQVLPKIRSGANRHQDEDQKQQQQQPGQAPNDYLPDEVIFSLTQPPDFVGADLPSSVARPRALPKPSNVWNYPKRREKLKHLTDSTICVCGAGKDISFLYDAPSAVKSLEAKATATATEDPSLVREQARKQKQQRRRLQAQGGEPKEARLPDTLIPEEFHVVKNKAVVGLEYNPSDHSTQLEDHEKHLVMFPSLKPTSRWEVLQLSKTFDQMLASVGVDEEFEVTGPTQMHRLLDLVKREQDVYNVVFHELIRQVTVECVERGQLLSTLRGRYNLLLSKVPAQVKSLHDEVMAQRALDRRLTEELLRFKTTIGVLTAELVDVKDHDRQISGEARATQEELRKALEEAKRSADLLGEYHGLYELQRARLEDQVSQLTEERELWSHTAYCLALKVMEETQLVSCKRLHAAEKAWQHLAGHFSVLLSERDTEDLARVQALVDTWREKVDVFVGHLRVRDDSSRKNLTKLRELVTGLQENFEDQFLDGPARLKQLLTAENTSQVLGKLRELEALLNKEANAFGGDVMLDLQESMASMRRLMLTWNDTCVTLFARHRAEDGAEFPEKKTMSAVSSLVEKLMRQLNIRLIGENGVARGVINLQNILETWTTRLQSVLNTGKLLPEQEWTRFYALIEDWLGLIDETISAVGSTAKEDQPANQREPSLDPNMVVTEVGKWANKVASGIDSEDTRMTESAKQLHIGMLRWMIQSLLRLAPDYPGNSQEAHQAALMASATPEELLASFKELGEWLTKFTVYLADSCSVIVSGIVAQRMAVKDEDFDNEQAELIRLKTEARDWCHAATCILEDLGFPYHMIPDPTLAANLTRDPRQPTQSSQVTQPTMAIEDSLLALQGRQPEASDIGPDGQQITEPATEGLEPQQPQQPPQQVEFASPVETEEPREESAQQPDEQPQEQPLDETVEAIGPDLNVHSRSLSQSPESPPQDVVAMEPGVRAQTPDAGRAFEALGALQQLQTQLRDAELRATEAEESQATVQLELQAAKEREAILEAKLEALKKELEEARAPPPPEEKKPDLLSA
ncbi:hypothetical protein BOX15_Mlig006576g2, partial [Macrostomum lignano]